MKNTRSLRSVRSWSCRCPVWFLRRSFLLRWIFRIHSVQWYRFGHFAEKYKKNGQALYDHHRILWGLLIRSLSFRDGTKQKRSRLSGRLPVHPCHAMFHNVRYVLSALSNGLLHHAASMRSLYGVPIVFFVRLPVRYLHAALFFLHILSNCMDSCKVFPYRSRQYGLPHCQENNGHAWSWSMHFSSFAGILRAILPWHCLNGLSVRPRSGHRQESAKFVPEQCVYAVRLTILWSVGHIL